MFPKVLLSAIEVALAPAGVVIDMVWGEMDIEGEDWVDNPSLWVSVNSKKTAKIMAKRFMFMSSVADVVFPKGFWQDAILDQPKLRLSICVLKEANFAGDV